MTGHRKRAQPPRSGIEALIHSTIVERTAASSLLAWVWMMSWILAMGCGYGWLSLRVGVNALLLIAFCCMVAVMFYATRVGATTGWRILGFLPTAVPAALTALWFGKLWAAGGFDAAWAATWDLPFGLVPESIELARTSQYVAVFEGYQVDEPRSFMAWILFFGETFVFVIAAFSGVLANSDVILDDGENDETIRDVDDDQPIWHAS